GNAGTGDDIPVEPQQEDGEDQDRGKRQREKDRRDERRQPLRLAVEFIIVVASPFAPSRQAQQVEDEGGERAGCRRRDQQPVGQRDIDPPRYAAERRAIGRRERRGERQHESAERRQPRFQV